MKKAIVTLLLAVLVASCDDFGDINQDPNNPSEAQTALLLTGAERSISDVIGAVTGTLYVQYFSETQYTEASRYETINFNFNSWYYNPLQNLQTIKELNRNQPAEVLSGGSNANQIAVANILQVYFYHFMTDRWGMIPFEEALGGGENLGPAYSDQQTIYTSMLDTLEAAAGNISTSEAAVSGDIIFDGDMTRWQQFANSLRLRIAMRAADEAPEMAKTHAEAAISAGLLEADAMYPYMANANNDNPWYERFQTRTDYAISEFMADEMKAIDDLRLTEYALPAPAAENDEPGTQLEEIVGMPYGIENAGSIDNSQISFPGSAIGAGGPGVGEQDAPLPIITTAELNFLKAEVAARGWNAGGTAAEFYAMGIEQSWKQWGVYGDGSDFTTYMAQPEVAYDPTNWEQSIGYQKWIALFPLGYEGWAEWRKLDYPELTPAPAAMNSSGEIPLRHGYPTSESQLNQENYEAAVSAQGEDALDTKLWWDVD
ncbi:SusD/RagB family nutrient-binding outer membrane lipoprotein [Fodinibius salsisoli]|uniref:SusD/RagB family nutrient-binding outer membrane lipoprotein n=1 Tax=Fodinibius salsisoli TaxID=2820877 RepID=A0ABT3PP43_9BACT|nr:SusD/RagB family nutrient-binding outer membrane lipoprotein [Fodinibius salsisoli]MCW9707634.1 SusD/RagB family nutrient-binding outer membrane lipoprotein [Fodinibius salsisoli]